MLPVILQNIVAIAFLGVTLGVIPCYTIYAGYKAIEQVKDLTKH